MKFWRVMGLSFLATTVLAFSPAQAAITVVNSAAALGSGATAITFDGPTDSTFGDIATNFGVTFAAVSSGATTFISPPGSYSGIGTLTSRALGSTNNGLISDISGAPDYSASALRSFDIFFANPLQGFGLTVQGWGHPLVTHSFTLFDAADQSLGSYLFSATGLVAGDSGPNGFAGFLSSGSAIARVRIAADPVNLDFVAFDNITFLAAPGSAVPEPAAWAMMLAGFGMAGAVVRRRRASRIVA